MALSFGDGDRYYHVPRTGGDFIRRTLHKLHIDNKPVPYSEVGGKHDAPADGADDAPARSFCTIRPPLAWYRSVYRYGVMKHAVIADIPPDDNPLDAYIWQGRYSKGGKVFSFAEFMESMYHDYPNGYYTHLLTNFIGKTTHVLFTHTLHTSLPMLLADWGYDTPTYMPKGKINATTDDKQRFKPTKRYRELARIDQGTLPGLPVGGAKFRVMVRRREAYVAELIRKVWGEGNPDAQ